MGPRLFFQRVPEGKVVKNRLHLDVRHDTYREDRPRRLTTETKASVKTTELIVYVLAVAGVLIASAIADAEDFGTTDAWRLVTYLTIGYMIARGLAKSGSNQPYDE